MNRFLALLCELAVIVLITGSIYLITRSKRPSPLDDIPGPWLWRVSALPYYLCTIRGTSHYDIFKIHQKYGDVVRIAPTQLSYTSRTAWTDVWARRPGHEEFAKGSGPVPVNGVQGILGADREAHRKYRRAFAHAFSAHGLEKQQPRIDRHIESLIDRLRQHDAAQPVDLVTWFHWVAFDIIGDLAFGASFGCLEDTRTHPWIADISGNLASTVWLTAARGLGSSWAIRYLMPRRLLQARQDNYAFVANRMSTRAQLGSDRGDFFDRIVASHQEEGGMTQEELESNASSIVLAGSETTATMLSGVIALLLQHQEVLKKLTRGLRETFTSADEITTEACAKDSYLLGEVSARCSCRILLRY